MRTEKLCNANPEAKDYFNWLNRNKIPISIISLYGNPIHSGHIDYISDAFSSKAVLVAIVNTDKQVKIKGSQIFMDEQERLKIISAIKGVQYAVLSIDDDGSVCETLRAIAELTPDCPKAFKKGGDRTIDNIPEAETCKELGILMIFGIGGEKTQSSSWLLNKLKKEEGNG